MRTFALSALLAISMTALAADDPPAPKQEPVDVTKTAERIVQNANEAGKRLHAKDPGADTRKLMEQILKDIDALIRKAQEPPPEQNMGGGMSNMNDMNMGGGMSNMNNTGGMSKQQQPMSSNENGPLSRKERRERAKQNASNNNSTAQQQPQPMSDPFRNEAKKNGGDPKEQSPNRIESKAAMPRVPDVYKEVWGHLPEKMRQELDLYFRDRFMPRYSELLRQYYSSLAERGEKANP